MTIQESYCASNYINQIALTDTVPWLLKFKSSNCRDSFCSHMLTNTSMAIYNNHIYRNSYGLTKRHLGKYTSMQSSFKT